MSDPYYDRLQISRRQFIVGAAAGSAALITGSLARADAPSSSPGPLLSALDLDTPGLSTVRDAIGRSDLPGANAAYAAFLRSRTKPVWTIDPNNPPKTVGKGDLAAANDALNHTFSSVGISYTFDRPIVWSFNPTEMPNSTHAVNYEWTWQFNRHFWWPDLARSYIATGDKRYSDELVAEILDWIAKNPVPAKAANYPGSVWRTLEAGLRAEQCWPDVYFLMLEQSDVFPDNVLIALVESLREHAVYLDSNHVSAGNWLFTEASGLYTVGALFTEFLAAKNWRTNAFMLLDQRLKSDVYPDGMEVELTPAYHNVCIDDLSHSVNLARMEGLDEIPDGYVSGIEKMYSALMLASAPTRLAPPLNDSVYVNVSSLLKTGLKMFPLRSDWTFLASNGAEGERPAETSCLLPWSGWAVMRTGWDNDDLFLLLDAGPFGLAHQHEDKLSFVLNAFGCELLTEAGTYTYDLSDMRKYVISARGHNVIHIDGNEQHRAGQKDNRTYVGTSPAALKWETNDVYDYASASYGKDPIEYWGSQKLRNAVHTRRILFVKPEFWIVLDTMIPSDDQEHVYESTFHLQAPSAVIDPLTLSCATHRTENANLAIVPLVTPDLAAKIITGQYQPFIQGWVPGTKSGADSGARPCVYYTRKGRGPIHFLYAFAPYKIGADPAVSSLNSAPSASALAAEINLADGRKLTVSVDTDGIMTVVGVAGKTLHFEPG